MKKRYICMSLIIYSLSNVYLGETAFAGSDKVEFQTNNETNNYLKKSDKIVRDTSEYPYEIENIYDSDGNEYFSLQPENTKKSSDSSDEVATDSRIAWLLKNYEEDQQFSQSLSKEEQKAATQIAIWHYTDPETTPISNQIIQDNPSIKNLIEEADKHKNNDDILTTNLPKISNRSVRSNENNYEITYTIDNSENNGSEVDSIKCYAVNGDTKKEVTNTEGINIEHNDSGTQINVTIDNELADSFGENVLFELEVDYTLECESYSGKVYDISDNSKKKQKQKNQLLLGSETNTVETKVQLSDSCDVGKGDSDTSYDQERPCKEDCNNTPEKDPNGQDQNSNGSCGNNENDVDNSHGNNGCGNNENDVDNSENENDYDINENDANNSDNENDYDINVEDATGGLVDKETDDNSENSTNEVDNNTDITVDDVMTDENNVVTQVDDTNNTSDSIIYEVDNGSGSNTLTSDTIAISDDFFIEVDNASENENFLPNTGSKNSYILSALGSFFLVSIATATYQKKKSF